MIDLTSLQKKILLDVYSLKGRHPHIRVERARGARPVVMSIGEKRLESPRAVDALSLLYSRGLLHQSELNRFVLTQAGRDLAKNLLESQN